MTSTTPVIYLIFNRPDLTERTFEAIRQAKPPKLYVVADGPRLDKPGEAELCSQTRRVTERIDWPCEATRDYSDINLGCGKRISSGITNAFRHFEEAIILEDDCLPHPSFFPYCAELLGRYRHDTRVMHIAGTNYQEGRVRGDASYYFSKFAHIWGWATWKRAWAMYDYELKQWDRFRDEGLMDALAADDSEPAFWDHHCREIKAGRIDTWDIQWMVSCWQQSGLSATPQVNLVSNIGNRPDGTHYSPDNADSPYANRATQELGPIRHPELVARNADADRFVYNIAFGGDELRRSRSLHGRARQLLRTVARWPGRMLNSHPAPNNVARRSTS